MGHNYDNSDVHLAARSNRLTWTESCWPWWWLCTGGAAGATWGRYGVWWCGASARCWSTDHAAVLHDWSEHPAATPEVFSAISEFWNKERETKAVDNWDWCKMMDILMVWWWPGNDFFFVCVCVCACVCVCVCVCVIYNVSLFACGYTKLKQFFPSHSMPQIYVGLQDLWTPVTKTLLLSGHHKRSWTWRCCGMWHSTVCLNLCHCASETCGARNRADPIFYSQCLCWPTRATAGGATPASDQNIKIGQSPFLRMTIFKLIQIQTILPLLPAFSSFSDIATLQQQHENIKCLSSSENSLADVILTFCSAVTQNLPVYGTAHAEFALCVLIVCGCKHSLSVALLVQTLGAKACHCIVNCCPVCGGHNSAFIWSPWWNTDPVGDHPLF